MRLELTPPPPPGPVSFSVLWCRDLDTAEFVVLPMLFGRGTLCRAVDYIAVKFYERLAPIPMEGRPLPDLSKDRKAMEFKEIMMRMVESVGVVGQDCRTKKIGEEDDSSYPDDRDLEQLEDPQFLAPPPLLLAVRLPPLPRAGALRAEELDAVELVWGDLRPRDLAPAVHLADDAHGRVAEPLVPRP